MVCSVMKDRGGGGGQGRVEESQPQLTGCLGRGGERESVEGGRNLEQHAPELRFHPVSSGSWAMKRC